MEDQLIDNGSHRSSIDDNDDHGSSIDDNSVVDLQQGDEESDDDALPDGTENHFFCEVLTDNMLRTISSKKFLQTIMENEETDQWPPGMNVLDYISTGVALFAAEPIRRMTIDMVLSHIRNEDDKGYVAMLGRALLKTEVCEKCSGTFACSNKRCKSIHPVISSCGHVICRQCYNDDMFNCQVCGTEDDGFDSESLGDELHRMNLDLIELLGKMGFDTDSLDRC